MNIGYDEFDKGLLQDLWQEIFDDIVVRLDPRGFLVQASANIAELGVDLSARLVPPHITDLTERAHVAVLSEQVRGVLAGRPMAGWLEFPVVLGADHHARGARHDPACRRWYALNLRPLPGEGEAAPGGVGLLRSVQQLRTLEGELHARAVTDPLTGLANRHAFRASLHRVLALGGGSIMAVLGVDNLRALLLRHGQRTVDEVVWAFAKFLKAMALPGSEIAQLDGERFGIILSTADQAEARRWCDEVIATFGALAAPAPSRGLTLSASAGLARIERTVDWSLREAELGLVMARAGGGGLVMRGSIPRAA